MRNSLLIVAVAAVTVFAACSGGGQMEKERKYTPVYLYSIRLIQILEVRKWQLTFHP